MDSYSNMNSEVLADHDSIIYSGPNDVRSVSCTGFARCLNSFNLIFIDLDRPDRSTGIRILLNI